MKINLDLYSMKGKESTLLTLACIIILLFFLPYFVLGTDANLPILDNLDGLIPHAKIIVESGNIISHPELQFPEVLNGISRSSLYGFYDFNLIWFYFLGIFWGYVFNKVFMAFVGFFGMFFLLKNFICSSNKSIIIPLVISLLYALIPYWSFTLSVAGLPLLSWAFLTILEGNGKRKPIVWLIFVFFPFFSSLFLSGLFILAAFSFILICDTIRRKRINFHALLALIILGICYMISHFPLFYTFIFTEDYLSHRTDFVERSTSFIGSILKSIKVFLFGQFHALSLQSIILIPVLIYSVQLIRLKVFDLKFITILLFLIVTSLFYGFLTWEPLLPFMVRITEFLPLQLNRFHFLHPMLWYVLLAISMDFIIRNIKRGPFFFILLFLFQIILITKNHDLIVNRNAPSFKQFYAEEQFEKIKKFIGKPQEDYRVISIGFHPAVAEYNGFFTLDGYVSTYPLKYKIQFRKVIEGELEKDEKLKAYYDQWGSRVYAFSSELGRPSNPKFNGKIEIENLDFNFVALRDMGGQYIISIARIKKNDKIKLLKVFPSEEVYKNLFLYEVI